MTDEETLHLLLRNRQDLDDALMDAIASVASFRTDRDFRNTEALRKLCQCFLLSDSDSSLLYRWLKDKAKGDSSG